MERGGGDNEAHRPVHTLGKLLLQVVGNGFFHVLRVPSSVIKLTISLTSPAGAETTCAREVQ